MRVVDASEVEPATLFLAADAAGVLVIRDATAAAAELYGYAPGELDGLPFAALAPTNAPTALAGVVAQRRKDGAFFVAELVVEDTPAGRRVEVRDRSAAQRAAELTAAEERHHHLFESIPLAAMVIDLETLEILGANMVANRVYGYEPGGLVGRRIADIMPPEVAAATAAA